MSKKRYLMEVTRHLNSTDSNQGLVDEYKRALYDMVAQHLAGEWKSNYYFKDGMRPYFTPGSTKFINASGLLGSEAVKNNCTLDNETLVLCGLEWSRPFLKSRLRRLLHSLVGHTKIQRRPSFPVCVRARVRSAQVEPPYSATLLQHQSKL